MPSCVYYITFAVCNAGYFGTGSDSCTLCTGSTTKPEVGDSATCDQVCDLNNSRPNEQRTMCGEYHVHVSGRIKTIHQFIASIKGAVQKRPVL